MSEHFSHAQIAAKAAFSKPDRKQVHACRRSFNQLGFAYQMAFVRLMGRFPEQDPLERLPEILDFVAMEFELESQELNAYAARQATLSQHAGRLVKYLRLKRFRTRQENQLCQFLQEETQRVELTSALVAKAQEWLQQRRILLPAETELKRLVAQEREKARQAIYQRILAQLPADVIATLEQLLQVKEERLSPLRKLKEPPGQASPKALKEMADKLETLTQTGILTLDLSWLNHNFQRELAHRGRQSNIYRLRELIPEHRYPVLVCLLWEIYRETLDQLADMQDKLLTKRYAKAKQERDDGIKSRRRLIQQMMETLLEYSLILLDEKIEDAEVRARCFQKLPRKELQGKIQALQDWISRSEGQVFPFLVKKQAALRSFFPTLMTHLPLEAGPTGKPEVLEAAHLVKDLKLENKRKVPDDAPIDFLPRNLRNFVQQGGTIQKSAYEWAVMTVVRDELKRGNLQIRHSQRHCAISTFFMPTPDWEGDRREGFFQKAGLPVSGDQAAQYLETLLNRSFEAFLTGLPNNTFVQIEKSGWSLSRDVAEATPPETDQALNELHAWLGQHIPSIKLPQLLIDIDNELHFTRHLVSPQRAASDPAGEVCNVIATVIAYGCNIGPTTMAKVTSGISYHDLKRIADWNLTEEALRLALAEVVNAIKGLDTAQIWGQGTTSSSDGQRFAFPRKVLQRTYSPRFGDFALEFYTFVADNYAPFYSMPIECTMRDAGVVLDGLLYHQSDLEIEEHYTDTHGYTELNFAALAMYGRRFYPRIRGLEHQWIYRITKDRDYGPLAPLVDKARHTIQLETICRHWDQMGHFYASLEQGHATASTALRRLIAFGPQNDFYRANRELGRIYKTQFILKYLSDPQLRQRIQRGLLKGEQLHGLARDVCYGKQGKIQSRELHQQVNTASCLTLILACIVYRQAREIQRIVSEAPPELSNFRLDLLEHISPIAWNSVILYGDYVLDRSLVKPHPMQA